MGFNCFMFPLIFFFPGSVFGAHNARTHVQNMNPNAYSLLAGIEILNHSSFNGVSSAASEGDFSLPKKTESGGDDFDVTKPSVKLRLKHRSSSQTPVPAKESLLHSTASDMTRIQTLHKRIMDKKIRNTVSKPKKNTGKLKAKEEKSPSPAVVESYAGKLMGTLKSGVTLGSGEYFMDVFVDAPPKHYSLNSGF